MRCFLKIKYLVCLLCYLSSQSHIKAQNVPLQQPVDITDSNDLVNISYAGAKFHVEIPLSAVLSFDNKNDDPCKETRAVVILGSSTLSFLVDLIDKCSPLKQHNPHFFWTQKQRLDLGKSDGTLDSTVVSSDKISAIITALENIKKQVIDDPRLHNAVWAVIATAWLREASNANEVINLVNEKGLGRISIIDQAAEGKFSWASAQRLTREEIEMTYDSGGRSFQVRWKLQQPSNQDDDVYMGIYGNVGMHTVKESLIRMTGQENFLPLPEGFNSTHQHDDTCIFLEAVCREVRSKISYQQEGSVIRNTDPIDMRGRTKGLTLFGVTRSLNCSVLPAIIAVRLYARSQNIPLREGGMAFQEQGLEGPGYFNFIALHEAIQILSTMSADAIRAIAPSAQKDPREDFSNMLLVYVVLQHLHLDHVQVLKVENSLQSALDELAEEEWTSFEEMNRALQ